MSDSLNTLRWGIIGGGLMGREIASALGRWFALQEAGSATLPHAELVAVCDTSEAARAWFRRVPTVRQITADAAELLANPDVDAVYIALPHHLHEAYYLAALRAGKDLLAEKPFGIDLQAAQSVRDEAVKLGRFVRVSSEIPYYPGGQRLYKALQNQDAFGRLLEVRAGFLHSSDLDPTKPANWKRQSTTCGEAGVLNDLGMHTLHLPLRVGLQPERVFAQLQKGYAQRPDGKGGFTACDTWDNATLHCDVTVDGNTLPMRLEMKRMAPGEMNTWYLEVLGTKGGIRFSTKEPKTLYTFVNTKEQGWTATDISYASAFPTVTGNIFEFGFPDSLLQMLAAFAAERAGTLGDRLGMVTPDEAVLSHELWEAALRSQAEKNAIAC